MRSPIAALFHAPESGVERVLFEAAWRNERIINYFRIAFGVAMGIPAFVDGVRRFGTIINSASWLLLWSLCAVGFLFLLRRTYPPWFAFVVSTLDATLHIFGLSRLVAMLDAQGQHAMADRALTGVALNTMFVTGICMVRFSTPIAVWTGAYAFSLYTAVLWRLRGPSPSALYEGILFAAFVALLVISSRRLREVVVRVKEREALARFLPAPALGAVRAAWSLRPMPLTRVKGKSEAIQVFALDGRQDTAAA